VAQVRNLRQLAALAGVSASTVSRALADSPKLAKSTREMIRSLASENMYHRNVTARNLRNKCTGSIGVVVPMGADARASASDPFFVTMFGLIWDCALSRDLNVFLWRISPAGDDWLGAFGEAGRVDGLIILGQADQFDAIEKVSSRYHPLVAWGANVPGQVHCSVGSDNRLGGRLAAEHLLERGCRRIVFLGDPCGIEIADRLAGCRDALQGADMEHRLRVVPVRFGARAAYDDIAGFLRSTNDVPDGVIAASDLIAMSALNAFAESGFVAPRDFRLIGFDGLAVGELATPAISTISQDLAAGAGHLVDRLLRRIAGEDADSVIMAPELKIRQST